MCKNTVAVSTRVSPYVEELQSETAVDRIHEIDDGQLGSDVIGITQAIGREVASCTKMS